MRQLKSLLVTGLICATASGTLLAAPRVEGRGEGRGRTEGEGRGTGIATRAESRTTEAELNRRLGETGERARKGEMIEAPEFSTDGLEERVGNLDADLSDSELLDFRSRVDNVGGVGSSELSTARNRVMDYYSNLVDSTVRNEEMDSSMATFLRNEVTNWDCLECVVGFEGVLRKGTEIAVQEKTKGSEMTVQRAWELALTETGKKESFKEKCQAYSWF